MFERGFWKSEREERLSELQIADRKMQIGSEDRKLRLDEVGCREEWLAGRSPSH